MLNLRRFAVLSLFVFIGCAAYTPPPLPPEHPAHPEGMAAPVSAPSTTLAYGPSDLPSPQPVSHMAQAQMPAGMKHGMHDTHSSQKESQQTVMGKGKVIAVVPSSNQLVVDHEAIEGFMDAMTMGYRVEPPSLLEGLNSGDEIHFAIDPQKKAIVKIEKMNK
jgi:Cu/Ag efflux protein CusF